MYSLGCSNKATPTPGIAGHEQVMVNRPADGRSMSSAFLSHLRHWRRRSSLHGPFQARQESCCTLGIFVTFVLLPVDHAARSESSDDAIRLNRRYGESGQECLMAAGSCPARCSWLMVLRTCCCLDAIWQAELSLHGQRMHVLGKVRLNYEHIASWAVVAAED